MGIGPVPAIRKLMARTGLEVGHVDLVELNEAFASQSLAVVRELGIDDEKVNVNGGAIAIGHPLGMSGARLVVSLLHELRRRRRTLRPGRSLRGRRAGPGCSVRAMRAFIQGRSLKGRTGLLQGGGAVLYFGTNAFLPTFLHAAGYPDLVAPCLAALNTSQLAAALSSLS